MDSGIYSSEKQVYEAEGIRAGTERDVWTIEVLECDNDDAAIALARTLSEKWGSRIKLFRVPFVNTTHVASVNLWPDQMKLVLDIPAPRKPEA